MWIADVSVVATMLVPNETKLLTVNSNRVI